MHATPQVSAVTRGPAHHFFGYYDLCPWDATGRFLLVLETAFMDRPPSAQDAATVGLVDLQDNCSFHPLATTRAWNWQQGCRLQWMPNAADRLIIYNYLQDGQFVSVILDVHTGKRRAIGHPIYTVAPDGGQAMTLNFARVHRTRPGYGYAGAPDPWADDPHPDEDGIWRLNLHTGRCELVISLADMAARDPIASMDGAQHWFNHLLFNPEGSRFIFLHRWKGPREKFRAHRLYTANPEGSDICCLAGPELVSHFDWCGVSKVLAWARVAGRGDHFYMFTDRSSEFEVIGEGVIDCDGHCSYSPDGRWVLTDTYPDAAGNRTLIAYHPATNRRVDLGAFYSPPQLRDEIRCDLHPRWSRDGRKICFDSAHEGNRQVYVVDFPPADEG